MPTWKDQLVRDPAGFFRLESDATGGVPVRVFLTERLLETTEANLFDQILNACAFPGVRCVVITPDVHYGYGVPVGCVIATDGTLAMGPVGFDIGCGMMAARSRVGAGAATPERRLAFNKEVMRRVEMGAGGQSRSLKHLTRAEFEEIVRGGAEHYVARYGATFDRTNAERHRIPVDDDWQIPYGGPGRPERGITQVGSLGGGNHFMELQADQDGKLWVMVHTGSRGFGHGLTTNFFQVAKRENPKLAVARPRLLHARVEALEELPERGGGGRQLRDREPAGHLRAAGARLLRGLRRGAGAGLRDLAQPGAAGAASRVRRGVGASQGRDAGVPGRASAARGDAVGRRGPSGADPRLQPGQLVRAPAGGGRSRRRSIR